MSDLINAVPSKWARPAEFDGEGKTIVIENFEELKWEDVVNAALKAQRKPPEYPPKDGIIRRLTFTQGESTGVRTLDFNTPNFQNDVSGKGIRKGSRGILARIKPEEKGRFKWNWTPVQNENV